MLEETIELLTRQMLEDVFKDSDSAEIYDRHFWNDDTLKCYVVSNKHNEEIKYKEPERIEKIDNIYYDENNKCIGGKKEISNGEIVDKINEIIDISNKYAELLKKNYV